MSYATYIMGTQAVYDPAITAALSNTLGSLFKGPYISNWRMLHIDGFEGLYPLPAHLGKTIQFFWSTKVGQKTWDGRVEWTNAGKSGVRVMYSDLQRQLDYQDARDRGSL